MKKYNYNKRNKRGKDDKLNKYINGLITRLLISIIVFFGVLIYTNNSSNLRIFKKYVIDSHLSFSKMNNLYNKYLGKVVLVKQEKTKTVFNETSSELKPYKNGYIKINKNKEVKALKEGIVVKIINKNNYKTVLIQGIDEIDYTYSYIDTLKVKLYDYVGKDNIIGYTKDKVYLSFKKNNMYLKYEEINRD